MRTLNCQTQYAHAKNIKIIQAKIPKKTDIRNKISKYCMH